MQCSSTKYVDIRAIAMAMNTVSVRLVSTVADASSKIHRQSMSGT